MKQWMVLRSASGVLPDLKYDIPEENPDWITLPPLYQIYITALGPDLTDVRYYEASNSLSITYNNAIYITFKNDFIRVAYYTKDSNEYRRDADFRISELPYDDESFDKIKYYSTIGKL